MMWRDLAFNLYHWFPDLLYSLILKSSRPHFPMPGNSSSFLRWSKHSISRNCSTPIRCGSGCVSVGTPSATRTTEATASPTRLPATDTPIPPTSTPEPMLTPQQLELVTELVDSIGPVYSLSWSPDGACLAAGNGVYNDGALNGQVFILESPAYP